MTNYDILKEYEAHKTPVPSYEEYNRLKEVERKKGKLVNVKYKIKQENNQLKELLKDCRHIMNIEKDFASCHFEKHKLDDLLTKIDNAIGENKWHI